MDYPGETQTAQTSSPTSAIMTTGNSSAGYYVTGRWRVKAEYLGDANCTAAESALANFTIVKAGARVIPNPPSQKIEYGESTPTFTPSTVFETAGDVWSTVPVCSIVTQEGASVTEDPIPPGAYVVKCAGGDPFSGDPVEYTNDPFIVEPADPTLTYTGSTGPIDAGDEITLSSTLSNKACTGTPTYAIGMTTESTIPVVSPTSTRRWEAGTYTITTTYAGDENCLPASDTQTIIVNALEVTVNATPASTTLTYGAPLRPFGPSTSGFLEWNGDPDTWVVRPSCTARDDQGDPIIASPLPVDTYSVECTGGDPGPGYTVEYIDGSLDVVQVDAAVIFNGTTGRIAPGDPVTLSIALSPDMCTSEVTYTLTPPDGSTSTVTSPLDTSTWVRGTYTITANYPDDENCNGASDTVTVNVQPRSGGFGWGNGFLGSRMESGGLILPDLL